MKSATRFTIRSLAIRPLTKYFPPCLLAGALLLAVAAPLSAQGGEAIQGFHRIDDYTLVVGGKAAPGAEMYQADSVPAILILSSALPSPVLLRPRSQSVETINLMKVAKQKDGTVNLLAGATLAPQGAFRFGDGAVAFAVNGRAVALKEKPPLLGPQSSAALKSYSPGTYARGAQAYQPNMAMIAALKKAAAPVTVRVFFGSWCPHCQQSLPGLIRVEDELKGSKVRFEYFGLPKKGMRDVAEVKRFKIEGVPTGIVYVNGKEAGRLEGGDAWVSPEVALHSIVAGTGVRGK
jgi:thiol-disulfide isomerase/thioredoxin